MELFAEEVCVLIVKIVSDLLEEGCALSPTNRRTIYTIVSIRVREKSYRSLISVGTDECLSAQGIEITMKRSMFSRRALLRVIQTKNIRRYVYQRVAYL